MAGKRLKQPGDVPLVCAHCDRPFGFIRGDTLHVDSRHGNDPHPNTLSLAQLVELLRENSRALQVQEPSSDQAA
jgi:hypothetical protein